MERSRHALCRWHRRPRHRSVEGRRQQSRPARGARGDRQAQGPERGGLERFRRSDARRDRGSMIERGLPVTPETLITTRAEGLTDVLARGLAAKISRRSFFGRLGKGAVVATLGGSGAALLMPEA